uniref:Ig-like domain-containing protein n=1 Tax=Zosterops lateralis melanops TaxID=1220523 RepID=A0A8D2PGW4_ZOSLA
MELAGLHHGLGPSTRQSAHPQLRSVTQQPSSLSANVGDTVRITCTGSSSYYGCSGNGLGWFQQKFPGTAPVTVIYWNDRRPSGIPSRFSGSTSGSTNTLTISGVQAEDEAVYFCDDHVLHSSLTG